MTDENKASPVNKESFIRWQGRTIEQFSFVNNLILVITTGFLVFFAQLAFNEKVEFTWLETVVIITSTIFNAISLALGSILAINRLLSFRYTAQIARVRNKNNVESLRNWTDEIDSRTWKLLWWNIVFFSLSCLSLVIVVIMKFAP